MIDDLSLGRYKLIVIVVTMFLINSQVNSRRTFNFFVLPWSFVTSTRIFVRKSHLWINESRLISRRWWWRMEYWDGVNVCKDRSTLKLFFSFSPMHHHHHRLFFPYVFTIIPNNRRSFFSVMFVVDACYKIERLS